MENYQRQLQEYRLDLISASVAAKPARRAVLFIHGGGFLEPADKRQSYISFFAQKLTRAGYLVVAPDYPVFTTEAQRDAAGNVADWCQKPAEAIHLAAEFVKENAEHLGVDPDRLAIIGGSAGGMSAFYAVSKYPADFKALVNFWGAPSILPKLENFVPVLSVHGTADRLVPYDQALALQHQLERTGIPHRLITLAGRGHTPIPQAAEYLPAALEFLEEHLS